MKIILSEKTVCKWLDLSAWQLENLRKKNGFPVISVSRELRFYEKQAVIKWVLGHAELSLN